MKSFFKSVLQQAVAQILVGIVLMGLAFVVLMVIIGKFAVSEVKVPKHSILVLNLNTNITDTPSQLGPQDLMLEAMQGMSTPSLYLHKVLDNIRAAAADPRIRGLFLHGNLISIDGGSGYPALREIRNAIQDFKKTGKPVHAYTLTPNLRTYCLISSADQVTMNPFGDLTLNGLSSEVPFYGGALEKFGVGVQPVRVGKYKSAIEPFTRKKFSKEGREQIQDLLKNRWDSILGHIRENRDFKPGKLEKILENSFYFDPEEALDADLVDEVATRQEVVSRLIEIGSKDADTGSFSQISLQDYAESRIQNSHFGSGGNTVAIVYIEGVIVEGESFTGYAGSSTFNRQLAELKNRGDVKAVVLRVNSPGGSATASEIMQQAIIGIQASGRPVVVSMGALAASGGYWVSAPAEQIIAQPETVTGSIGVYGLLLDIEGLSEKIGVTFDSVNVGEHINPFTIARPKNEEELAFVQEMVDDIYEAFITNVAGHRDMERDQVHAIAQGRVWSGAQAVKHGLVDEIGGLEYAIETAADLAGLDEYEIEHHPKEMTSIEVIAELLGEDLAKARTRSSAETRLHYLRRQIESLRVWNDHRNIYTLLPLQLH